MWVNELGVAPTHRRRGIATRLIGALCDHARTLGCTEAWVISDPTEEALGFYRSLDAPQTGTHLAMFTIRLTPDDQT
jgi:GNAT superfamily N-acetyltransferase